MTRILILAVAVYAALVAALVALAGPGMLAEPVAGYRLSVFWALPDTSADRLGALTAAGRGAEAALYLAVERLSYSLLVVAALVGLAVGLRGAPALRLPRREAVAVLVGFVLVVGTAGWVKAMAMTLEARGAVLSGGFTAAPGYWIGTTAISCAVLARYAALGAHDLAVALRALGARLKARRALAAAD